MLRSRAARAVATILFSLASIALSGAASNAQPASQAPAVRTVALTVHSVTDSVRVALVPPDFAKSSPISALLGRAFLPGDFAAPARDVVIISHRLWTRRFGAQPTVIGDDVLIDGRHAVIVGVAPKGLAFPGDADLLAPKSAR
jgi:hypothetical protein